MTLSTSLATVFSTSRSTNLRLRSLNHASCTTRLSMLIWRLRNLRELWSVHNKFARWRCNKFSSRRSRNARSSPTLLAIRFRRSLRVVIYQVSKFSHKKVVGMSVSRSLKSKTSKFLTSSLLNLPDSTSVKVSSRKLLVF